VQLSAQLTTLTPRLGAPGPRERRAPAAAPWVPPLQSHVPSIPAWQRRPLWIGGGLAVAAAAASAWVCLHRPAIDVFADLGTRPYEIRFAYGEAARHRPRHEAVLGGAGAASASDRVSYDRLSALEARGDQHGFAIAQAWNGERVEAIKRLGELAPTDSVRADGAALTMLTSSRENAEPVLAELERLRSSGDADAARAARWNYALLLAQLELPLSAAQALRAIADDHEPGWSEEAGARAELLSEDGRAFHDTWQRARQAGEALVDAGAPVAGELLQARPGVLRAYFYDAVRTAPSRDRVLSLDAMAAALDRIAGRDQRTLSDYVHRVARLDFRRRAPLAAAYAALLRRAPVAEPVALALTRETASLDVADIVMAAMIERGVVAEHGAWFQAMAERTGDPWFAVVLARAEADAALTAGQVLDAEAILRRAEALCTPALTYQCLTIGRRLGKLYADLHRVPEALDVLRRGVALARRAGEWGRYRALLWQLADTERFHSATATVRAFAGELLMMRDPVGDDCENRGQTYDTLTGAALIDLDGAAARRYLREALRCEPADLRVANHLADIARLDPQPDDLAQVQALLTQVRSGPLTASERVLADEIEGRLVIQRDRAAGTRLLRKAIASADAMPSDVVADKARADAYAVLALDAATAGDEPRTLEVIAEELGLPLPARCAVGITSDDGRLITVVRDVDGADHGARPSARRARADAAAAPPAIPAALARTLAGCPRVQVMAPAALQGQPRVLPRELPWSYTTSARGRFTPPDTAPRAPRALLVANVTPPNYLPLPPLAIQPPAGGATTTLSGLEATPARVLAAMATATEIQFHTHALLDVGVSDASHLVLAPDASGRYALTAEAIRTIRLVGHPVIVLMACHSAQGARYQHAPWSLPDAFLAVGARAVVAAATAIPDAGSGAFFTRLLAAVRAGADPAVALRDLRLAPESRAGSWVDDIVLFE